MLKAKKGPQDDEEETKALTNIDVHLETQELMKSLWIHIIFIEQEEQLDVIHGAIKSIRYAGEAIHQEADTHVNMLNQAETEVLLFK